MASNEFSELLSAELSGVTFVRDYLQLQFDPPPILNLLTQVTLEIDGRRYLSGSNGFADALIRQIGKVVRSVEVVPDLTLDLKFADGSVVSASLKPADCLGAEAVVFSRRDRSSVVL
jgi:hypothetical protein